LEALSGELLGPFLVEARKLLSHRFSRARGFAEVRLTQTDENWQDREVGALVDVTH